MRWGEYPDDWEERRKHVLERDEYECQDCGATDSTLHVHHLTPISEGGSHDLDNLQAICESCHAEEHPTKVKISTALSENRRVRMKYRSSSGTRVREFDPYGMEMHEGIQYLVGRDYYRNEIRIFRPTRIDWIEVLDTSFDPPERWDTEQYLVDEMGYQRTKSESGCFIATAAYGTHHAEEIDELREFRDDVLLKSRIGSVLVQFYYRTSPPIAELISRSDRSRTMVRKIIIEPSLRIVRRFTSPTASPSES